MGKCRVLQVRNVLYASTVPMHALCLPSLVVYSYVHTVATGIVLVISYVLIHMGMYMLGTYCRSPHDTHRHIIEGWQEKYNSIRELL